jgi:hypothetical protein
MYIWGITKKYKTLSWWDNFMSGHISIGPITIWGANAMRWAVNIHTKGFGYICFTLPVLARWRKDRYGKTYFDWYFYLSPNGTPWACTFYRGSDKQEVIRAQIRRFNFGHGFSSGKLHNELFALNNKFDSLRITEYEVEKYGSKNTD